MKKIYTLKSELIFGMMIFASILMPFNLYSQEKDTIPGQSKGTSYTARNYGSDCYIYAEWSGLYNACAIDLATTFYIDYYDYENSMGKQYVIGNKLTYSGKNYKNLIGPSKTATFYFQPHYTGVFCDYWDPKSSRSATTFRIKPPGNISATYDDYDTKIVLAWDGSLTDVPTNWYDYRIYRDEALIATVGHNIRTWTDENIVPGVEYDYSVVTHSAHFGNKESVRNVVQGKAFDLNVRTNSLSDGVRILWDRPPSKSKVKPDIYLIDRRDEAGNLESAGTANSSANAFRDQYTGVPIPGYSYTYIVTPSLNGIYYRSDSAYGHMAPNGAFSGKVTAPTGGPVSGVVVCAERLDDIPQGTITTYCDTTDGHGKYYIPNIYYYNSASFKITPFKTGHGFNPSGDTSLINLATPSWTSINFTDTSSFTITGWVYQVFNGDTCNVNNCEILVDDLSRGYKTGDDGKFDLTVEQTGIYTFTPQLYEHGFAPADRTFSIGDDLSGVNFEDTTRYIISGKVSGPCNIYIGTADLRIYSKGGACFDTTITSDHLGNYSVALPARDYFIEMVTFYTEEPLVVTDAEVEAYFNTVDEVELTRGDATQNFIYRKAPEVQVGGFGIMGCGTYAGIPVLQQGKTYNIPIDVVENFNGATCNTDTGYVVVEYHPGDSAVIVDTLQLVGGSATYELAPETPNIISPYLNLLEITAHVGIETDYFSQQILVTGNRPRTATFVSVSPEIPFVILRDPPGDASYSNLSKGTTLHTSFRISAQMSGSVNIWGQVKLGAEFEAGQFVFVKSKIWGQVKKSLEIGASLKAETELGLSITNSEEFSTSGNDNITGETGDVFAGASLNMVYALTDVIEYDTANCTVNKSVDMIMAPNGFKTTFIYTENHIRSVLIPQLEQIRDLYQGVDADSMAIYQNQVTSWQQILAMNTDLKNRAAFSKNISFSNGAPYGSTEEITTSLSGTIESSMYIENNIATELGFEFGGSGISGGVDVKFRMEVGASSTTGVSSTTTTGYFLDDDDGGDYFSVDVLKDYAYGTPVFKLVSGRSSCPWEPGTQPRDGVQLISDAYSQYVNNPDDPAVFKLSLGNTSQSDEERTYDLVFLQESNPDGAVLTLGGSQVQGGIPTPYTVPAGSSVDATVTVSRGPSAYDYNDLKFVLSSPCDGSISDEVALNAHFQSNCSDISLGKPLNNWLINSKSNNILPVQLLDYDVDNLETVVVEYSETDVNDWTALVQYDKTQLDPDFTAVDLSFEGIPDGFYDVRAKLTCSGIVKYTDVRSGIVDRTPPTVFGQPEPTDGVLDPGDIISVTFNEAISCINISPANVVLTDISKDQVVSTQVGCSGDKIIILPDTAGLTFQNDTFKVVVTGIADVFGNVSDTISWAFNVTSPGDLGVSDDDDTDADGIINSLDNCPIAYNPDQADLDSNGVGDVCDPDIDGDGIVNDLDNCPFVSNAGQTDTDTNGIGDVCDPDIDGDGIMNDLDNCPFVANLDQADADSNGVGNVCESTGIHSLKDAAYQLFDCYPNPFSDYTTIAYTVPEPCWATIKVYNLLGKEVAVLSDQKVIAGLHEITWNSMEFSKGIYFFSLQVKKSDGAYIKKMKKMILSH